MKKILSLLTFTFLISVAKSQITEPVTFTYAAKKKTGNTYELIITANLQKGWHIYSQQSDKNGSLPTKITFNANPLITITGKPKETGKLVKLYDKTMKANLQYYSNTVTFIQTVTLKAAVKTNITGTINYMLCDDSKCLPPSKKTFDISIQ